MNYTTVAFVPARSGSKRIENKNVKLLAGHPLLSYTIQAALDSGIFNSVICVTDSPLYAEIASYYGAEVPTLRPTEISTDYSPDIDWIVWILEFLREKNRKYDIFSILRPTSPFRTKESIKQAYSAFIKDRSADSLRAVGKCQEHPGKMWVIRGNRMLPILPFQNSSTPWHSSQYSTLPEVYVQDASLEIAWSRTPLIGRTIAGETIMPFISKGLEGFDINEPNDWALAETFLNSGRASLPKINIPPFKAVDS